MLLCVMMLFSFVGTAFAENDVLENDVVEDAIPELQDIELDDFGANGTRSFAVLAQGGVQFVGDYVVSVTPASGHSLVIQVATSGALGIVVRKNSTSGTKVFGTTVIGNGSTQTFKAVNSCNGSTTYYVIFTKQEWGSLGYTISQTLYY